MRKFTVEDLSNRVDDITEAADREPVVLTRGEAPSFVLMSYDDYTRLTAGADPRSAHLTSEMPAEHVELFGAELASLAGNSRKPGALRGRIKPAGDFDD